MSCHAGHFSDLETLDSRKWSALLGLQAASAGGAGCEPPAAAAAQQPVEGLTSGGCWLCCGAPRSWPVVPTTGFATAGHSFPQPGLATGHKRHAKALLSTAHREVPQAPHTTILRLVKIRNRAKLHSFSMPCLLSHGECAEPRELQGDAAPLRVLQLPRVSPAPLLDHLSQRDGHSPLRIIESRFSWMAGRRWLVDTGRRGAVRQLASQQPQHIASPT